MLIPATSGQALRLLSLRMGLSFLDYGYISVFESLIDR